MGKLIKMSKYNRILRILFLLPSVLIFVAFNKQLVNAFTDDELLTYKDLSIKVEKDSKGLSQIKTLQGQKIISTTDHNFNHANASLSGDVIVWMSQIDAGWQIFLKHVISGKEIQLTFTGNNVNPIISGNYVSWERQFDGVWQIVLFDGIRSKQITDNSNAKQLVGISTNYLIYLQKSSDNAGWELFIYDILTDDIKNISNGNYVGSLEVGDDNIFYTATSFAGEKTRFSYNLTTGISTTTDLPSPTSDEPGEIVEPPKEIKKTEYKRVTVEEIKKEFIEKTTLPEEETEDEEAPSEQEETPTFESEEEDVVDVEETTSSE